MLNKTVFKIALIAFAFNIGSFNIHAARSCRTVIGDTPSLAELTPIRGSDRLNISGRTLVKVKELFATEGVSLRTKNLREALVIIGEKLRDGSETPSMVKSEKLALFGDKLLALVKPDFEKSEFMMISYFVGEAVLKQERIPIAKYKKTNAPSIFETAGVLNISQFHKYVESYVDGTAAYRNLPSDVGFISWTDIRHLYSNNSWGIGLRDHDMYHLHYAYGHPYYLAVNFQTSRGINDRRYAMVSSYWESVDTNQTSFETKMSNFFSSKNMSPQEGMIYLARATKAMMKEIDNSDGDSYNNETAVEVVNDNSIGLRNGWKPYVTNVGRTSTPDSLAVFDKEIEDFINKSLLKRASTSNKKYYNFHRLGPGRTAARDDDTSH